MSAPEPPPNGATLDGGSYDVIRRRLLEQAADLAQRAQRLNLRRQQLFGGGEISLVATDRVRTANNCIPRDVVSVSGQLLFGFQVFIGLKSETTVNDVLSLYRFAPTSEGFDLTEVDDGPSPNLLQDPEFDKQFRDAFRYNRDTRLLQLRRTDNRLLVVIQTGSTLSDVRIFRFAIDAQGRVLFMDARGEEDFVPPRSHPFEWVMTTRENQVPGPHPHMAILNEVFVETVGGDLTVKIENNTTDGLGIYREPVEDANQTLDDAEISYAKVGGLILLRIKPFREEQRRYLVYNTRTSHVLRIDALEQACVELPENHGILFPGGYYLQNGEYRLFGGDTPGLRFERAIPSPNGEDVLYVFYRQAEGNYELLPYNLVKKEIATPIRCNGYSLFDNGTMLVFRASPAQEPSRVHPVQIWRTPFTTLEFAASAQPDPSYLSKLGNADLVAAISEILSLCKAAQQERPTRKTFEDIVGSITRLVSNYHWLGHNEAEGLADGLKTVLATTELLVGEFEKALLIEKRARDALAGAERLTREKLARIRVADLRDADAFLQALTELRAHRGSLISLKEQRAIDLARVDSLESDVVTRFDEVSRGCVDFFLQESAFTPLLARIEGLLGSVAEVTKSVELQPLLKDLGSIQEGLGLLTETMSGLSIDDPTKRTQILDGASTAFSQQNRARAILEGKQHELLAAEGRAAFGVQFTLLGQSVTAALALATTPEACDQQLSRLMLQFEELEGRFGMLEEFSLEIGSKREEVLDAVTTRRQALIEERQRRARHLVATAERIMSGVLRRAKNLRSADELNAYFASDPMLQKLEELRDKLRELGESTQADELESRLISAKQTALRMLRDKSDLFEDEGDLIRLGTHRFTVSELSLDLAVVPRSGTLCFHLTGTDFYEAIDDVQLDAAKVFWTQDLVSETPEICRAEFLATSLFLQMDAEHNGGSGLAAAVRDGKLSEYVRAAAAERLDEGYEPGVHELDAQRILERLLSVAKTAGPLRFSPTARALGWLYWHSLPPDRRDFLERRAQSAGRLASRLMDRRGQLALAADLEPELAKLCHSLGLDRLVPWSRFATRALIEELAAPLVSFSTSHHAVELERQFLAYLDECGARRDFEEDLRLLDAHLAERLALAMRYLDSYFDSVRAAQELLAYRFEATVRLCLAGALPLEPITTETTFRIDGLLAPHPRIVERAICLRLDETLERVQSYLDEKVLQYRAYRQLRAELATRKRQSLRLDEFAPKVLTSFVRNRLIDEVYLPLVGANLAKQLGAAGSAKRTDLMGLLLLVSPPGYGKTTLMEYVASRLGLIFIKVNGPALGTEVRSLDASEVASATARQEVEKINLALEMGNNVMLYLDDIQHTHPELLQKFISLCDAQRRIEGIWKGRTRTYDLRGKRFCIVMAGNPYTESGARFQIPDMLANRADTYNLGDILDGRQEAFALSYIENALTSNKTLSQLASRDVADVYKLIDMAQGKDVAATELSHDYASTEVEELVSVLRHLLQIQRVLLKVNLEYIASASKDDKYRTEPPFKLQGSYRNMNKLAEKVVAAMNADEIERLIDDHYAGESQTLTKGAEQNLLKLGELRQRLSPAQLTRWQEIKQGYQRVQRMGGQDDDPIARVTGSISGLDVQLGGIREALSLAIQQLQTRANDDAAGSTPSWLESLEAALGKLARPRVEVTMANPAPSEALALLGEHLNHLGATLTRATTQSTSPATSASTDDKLNDILVALDQVAKSVAEAQRPVWHEEVDLSGTSDSNFYRTLAGDDIPENGGVFVATWAKPPSVGSPVELTLIAGANQRETVRGVVAFVKDDLGSESPPGYGVRLTQITANARGFIDTCTAWRAPLVY